jgi:D-3-phosphoglycerate dehydrogenase
MSKTVLISIRANPGLMWNSWNPAIELLEEAGLRVVDGRMHEAVETERLIGLVGDADGLIVGLERVDASVIEAGPKLKFIGKPGAGWDNIDLK